MSCPKCGYSGHNTVSHWGTGEIECENCRHDYIPVKKSKEKSSGLPLLPSLLSSCSASPRTSPVSFIQKPCLSGEEIMMENKLMNHLMDESGMDYEQLFLKKSQKGQGFSTVLGLSKDLIGNSATAKMLSEKFGWDPERAWREVSMPKLNF